jgi:hypothetical protein
MYVHHEIGLSVLLLKHCFQDFTEKACQDKSLPQLQAEMLTLGHGVSAQWGQLVRAGLQRAWAHVHNRDITAAQTIIANLVCFSYFFLILFINYL